MPYSGIATWLKFRCWDKSYLFVNFFSSPVLFSIQQVYQDPLINTKHFHNLSLFEIHTWRHHYVTHGCMISTHYTTSISPVLYMPVCCISWQCLLLLLFWYRLLAFPLGCDWQMATTLPQCENFTLSIFYRSCPIKTCTLWTQSNCGLGLIDQLGLPSIS